MCRQLSVRPNTHPAFIRLPIFLISARVSSCSRPHRDVPYRVDRSAASYRLSGLSMGDSSPEPLDELDEPRGGRVLRWQSVRVVAEPNGSPAVPRGLRRTGTVPSMRRTPNKGECRSLSSSAFRFAQFSASLCHDYCCYCCCLFLWYPYRLLDPITTFGDSWVATNRIGQCLADSIWDEQCVLCGQPCPYPSGLKNAKKNCWRHTYPRFAASCTHTINQMIIAKEFMKVLAIYIYIYIYTLKIAFLLQL